MSSRRTSAPGPKRPGQIKHLSTHAAEDLDELWSQKREDKRPKTAEERAKHSEDLIKRLQESDRFAAAAAAREECQRKVEAKAHTKLRQKQPGPRTTICKSTDDGTQGVEMLGRVPTLEFLESASASSSSTKARVSSSPRSRKERSPLKAVPLSKKPPLPLGVKRVVVQNKAGMHLALANVSPSDPSSPRSVSADVESPDQPVSNTLQSVDSPQRGVVFAAKGEATRNSPKTKEVLKPAFSSSGLECDEFKTGLVAPFEESRRRASARSAAELELGLQRPREGFVERSDFARPSVPRLPLSAVEAFRERSRGTAAETVEAGEEQQQKDFRSETSKTGETDSEERGGKGDTRRDETAWDFKNPLGAIREQRLLEERLGDEAEVLKVEQASATLRLHMQEGRLKHANYRLPKLDERQRGTLRLDGKGDETSLPTLKREEHSVFEKGTVGGDSSNAMRQTLRFDKTNKSISSPVDTRVLVEFADIDIRRLLVSSPYWPLMLESKLSSSSSF